MASNPRFLYGFLSQSSNPINISLPWTSDARDGSFKMNYREVDAILDNLSMWANTNWGDRPFRFFYGLDARRYLFEPIPVAKQIIESNARSQLAKFFPQVKIVQLKILSSEDDSNIPENSIRFYLDGEILTDKKRKIKLDLIVGS